MSVHVRPRHILNNFGIKYLETDHTFFVIDKFRADSLEDAQEIQRRLTDERKVQMLKCDQKARVPGLITWD